MFSLRTSAATLFAVLLVGCREHESARPPLQTAESSSPRAASPSDVPSPEPLPAPSEPASASCDPTGTWRLTLEPARLFCEGMREEAFDLALGFVDKDGQTALAGSGKAGIGAGEIGRLLPGMRVSLLSGLGSVCEVRLQVAKGHGKRSPHAEMVFRVDGGKLFGFGTRWSDAAPCDDSFVVRGERTAPVPDAWAGLAAPALPRLPFAPRPASDELAAAVAEISARSLLGGVTAKDARTPLRGSILEYIAAVVGQPRDVTLVEVACSSTEPPVGRCVAVVGDPCGAEPMCEGMFLTVVVDLERGRLDRAENNGYPVESHADIANWEKIAP